MILIFSNSRDYSTYEIVRWLHYMKRKDVMIINHDATEFYDLKLDVDNEDFTLQINHHTIKLSEITGVWFRKGKNWLHDWFYPIEIEDSVHFTRFFNQRMKEEAIKLSEYLDFLLLNQAKCLGNPRVAEPNKLITARIAQECGFLTPDIYVTNHKTGLGKLMNKNTALITKALSDGMYFFDYRQKQSGYITYTEEYSKEDFEKEHDKFSPSLLQNAVEKQYELRIFFLEGKCFTSAIFSQNDEQTKTDFRKYNTERPNRTVPFQLPEEIELRIQQLFRKMELNTGSVDIMVDKQERYYFLEINPVGQFSMVSHPCNYYIEPQIAQYLAHS